MANTRYPFDFIFTDDGRRPKPVQIDVLENAELKSGDFLVAPPGNVAATHVKLTSSAEINDIFGLVAFSQPTGILTAGTESITIWRDFTLLLAYTQLLPEDFNTAGMRQAMTQRLADLGITIKAESSSVIGGPYIDTVTYNADDNPALHQEPATEIITRP